MKQKIFLTSVIAMGFVAPAMAEPSNTDTFPQDGLMLEDYTYTNAATSTNMAGVYEGTVDAVAQYTDNLYQLVAGQYLPANSETPIDCDQNGYFCPGDNNGVYYSSSAQGLTQCPSGYGNSGTGASANIDCYRICTNADVAHSTGTVNGGYYYGDNNQCEPTACENGWHVKEGNPDLVALTGTTEKANGYGVVSNDGTYTYHADIYGLNEINDRGKFVVDFGVKGKITGRGQCSSYSGTGVSYNTTDTLPDNTGSNCWCILDNYTTDNGNEQAISSPWMFTTSKYNDRCGELCSQHCAVQLHGYSNGPSFVTDERVRMYDIIQPSLASCEANTITINWTGTSETEINANNAGTATYGSDIRTPRSATPVPGKTFTGWRFSAPQQASVEPQGD